MYIEGANFGSSHEGTDLYNRFGLALAGLGNLSETGNIETVFGEPGTIADGLDYDYLYQQPPDNLLDNIEATGGILFFKSQDGLGRGVSNEGPSNTYRTIHTSFIFGALVNGIHTKNDLMQSYVEYLTGCTAVEEYDDDLTSTFSPTVSPNPFQNSTIISLGVSSRQYAVSRIAIFDITGRLVKQWNNPTIQPSNQIRWDGTDDMGRRVSSGSYIVRIETDRDVANKAVVLLN